MNDLSELTDEVSIEMQCERLESGLNINHFEVGSTNRRKGRGTEAIQTILEFSKDDSEIEYIVVNMKGGEPAVFFLETLGFDIVGHDQSDGHVTAEMEIGA